MLAQIYRHTSPRRPTLRAVFAKDTAWGDARGGHAHESWMLESEVDLARPNRTLPFDAAKALAGVQRDGIFQFQVLASELLQTQHAQLNNYRLKFTLPIFTDPPGKFDLLGTGTLFEHEGRSFIVTADHIFRVDPNDPNSPLIDMTTVAVPVEPRAAGSGVAAIVTLGDHTVWRITPPVMLDVIVLELLDAEVIATLKRGWAFLPFSQAEPPRPDDDRFVITGFMQQGIKVKDGVVSQAMLNLETDYLHYIPALSNLAPAYDLFFHLQADCATVDGSQRTLQTLKGVSGGPIWAVRDLAPTDLWHPSKAMKIVATQSAERASDVTWSRGFRWDAVLEILRQPKLGFGAPP